MVEALIIEEMSKDRRVVGVRFSNDFVEEEYREWVMILSADGMFELFSV